jgi:hypothetical protein
VSVKKQPEAAPTGFGDLVPDFILIDLDLPKKKNSDEFYGVHEEHLEQAKK